MGAGMGVGYEKKTILHSFKKVAVEFAFCEWWEYGTALKLKSQPWCVTIPGVQWQNCSATGL